MKKLLVALAGMFGFLYLLNPSAGIFELIPDNLPFIGNLDEATAAALVLAALRYYGIDLTGFMRKGLEEPKKDTDPDKN